MRDVLAAEEDILRIGHARTRGYGRVRFRFSEAEDRFPQEQPHHWQGRLRAWSEAMLAQALPPEWDRDGVFLFAISFPTGAILVDELLRYTLDPSGMAAWLPALPPPDPALRILERPGKAFASGKLWCVTAVAHHERLRGWNAAHGLPRQDEWLVRRGSVYVYLYRGDATGCEQLIQRLWELHTNGIGARRNEGYGQVLISDPFHTRYAQGFSSAREP